jgi:CRP/FNR family transcriptional regulator/CRP/FNR family cyclic AMP-dependent transcriptional regulator
MLSEDLKPVSFFSDLSEVHRKLIQSKGKEMSVSKGTVVIEQEEESFDLYIILSGKVMISLISEDGREVVLDVLKKGDFFGELSVLDRRHRSAMVTAITDVRMLFVSRDSFLKILEENSDMAINLLSVMANRLRKANETIETLTFLDVAGRVAKVLIDMAKSSGERLPNGFIRVHCPTHQTIANQIGASREAVTKAIKNLVSNRLIEIEGKDIVIPPKQFEIL